MLRKFTFLVCNLEQSNTRPSSSDEWKFQNSADTCWCLSLWPSATFTGKHSFSPHDQMFCAYHLEFLFLIKHLLFCTKDGSTLLHLAAKCGHPEICTYLITKGVLVQMPNKVTIFSLIDRNAFYHYLLSQTKLFLYSSIPRKMTNYFVLKLRVFLFCSICFVLNLSLKPLFLNGKK